MAEQQLIKIKGHFNYFATDTYQAHVTFEKMISFHLVNNQVTNNLKEYFACIHKSIVTCKCVAHYDDCPL